MSSRHLIAALVLTATALAGSEAAARTDEDREREDRADTVAWSYSSANPAQLTPEEVGFMVEYERYRTSLQVGYGFFGGGFGVVLVGIVLTVIDPYGMLGLAGFITVGGGVVSMSSGMFVLGLSRSAWQESLREEYGDLLKARTVSYSWYF